MTAKKKPAISAPEAQPAPGLPGFHIVGIGASAGGLAAIESFFSAIPKKVESGLAFIIVQHLSPDHKSILRDLVQRYTNLKVFEVEDGMMVQPNCAYIIPPNKDMALLNGALQLLEPAEVRGRRLPIDFFFRSMAQDLHERAVCVVLSGSGSDGTLGVRAIKGEGGMVMAQKPESTEYDSMPRSAIATGMVDYILLPAEMPAQLIAYTTHSLKGKTHPVSAKTSKAEDVFNKIFILLRSQTGHDFSMYKPNTINRRIERRMAVHQITRINDYIRFLQQNPIEVDSLFKDLLIGVTNFFRDPEAFNALEKQVIPQLFTGKTAGTQIRVWVPGCSTGEEVYSIAILIKEYLDSIKKNNKVQIFASDIDSHALEQARSGIFPASIAADITPKRLARFFSQEKDGGDYRVQKNIRDMIIFSEQDVIQDPPFSRLDLISCRNLLIYMNGDLQKRLVPLFHYALNTGGFLFLGTSETVSEFSDLFTTVDRKMKIFQCKAAAFGIKKLANRVYLPPLKQEDHFSGIPLKTSTTKALSLRELTEQSLLQKFSPAGALINEQGNILYLHGRTGKYLEPAQGEADTNILKMAREGLKYELTAALHQAAVSKKPIRQVGLRVKTNGDFTTVNLSLQPVAQDGAPALFLVIFEDVPEVKAETPEGAAANKKLKSTGKAAAESVGEIARLKAELQTKNEYLQTATEDLETSNEELKSSNEEMQSVNEEIQSTNEELETSKEELQSVNEELTTVNAELQTKVADLTQANNDKVNLLGSTGIGAIFVDMQQNIRFFTPKATLAINLIPLDVGRPLGHIAANFANYNSLVEDVQEVLDSLIPKEFEVQTKTGEWYLINIRPYRTTENVIDGAVINIIDITELNRARKALKETEALSRLAVVVRDASDAILMVDNDGQILAWNPAAEKMYGWSEAMAKTMNIKDITPESEQKQALEKTRQIARARTLKSYSTQRVTRDKKLLKVWVTATALVNEAGEVYAISTIEREADPVEPGK